MAITQNTYTGNGSTVLFSFTFPYLETTDIKVSLDGIITTAYTLANATTIQFNTAPANGAAIRIYRQTDDSDLSATFYPGSAIRSQDLNDNFTQNLYVTQEVNNNSVNIDGSNPMVGPLNMNGFQITNLPVPAVDTNAATKKYVDDRFGNLDIPGHTRWRKAATASQTTFSGTGDYGGVLAYSPTREQVYINGALQQRGVDYAADNGTSVVFTVGLTVGDVVDIICVNNLTNSAVSNAGNITYSGQFTGQAARTVAAKLTDVVSVKDFGAVGDGVTDDTAAIQAAIDSVNTAGGGTVYFPTGTYAVSTALSIYSNVRYLGAGTGATILQILGTPGPVAIFRTTASVSDVEFDSLGFVGSVNYPADSTVYKQTYASRNTAIQTAGGSVSGFVVKNCSFTEFSQGSIDINGAASTNIKIANNTFTKGSYCSHVINIRHQAAQTEANRLTDVIISGNTFDECGPEYFYDPSKEDWVASANCIIVDRIKHGTISDNIAKDVAGGIRVEDSKYVAVTGNVVTGAGGEGISFYKYCTNCSATGNVIQNWGRIPFAYAIRNYSGTYVVAREFPDAVNAPLPADPTASAWFDTWPYVLTNVNTASIIAYSSSDYYTGPSAGILPFRGYAAISYVTESHNITVSGNTILGDTTQSGGKFLYACDFGVTPVHSVNSPTGSLPGQGCVITGNSISEALYKSHYHPAYEDPVNTRNATGTAVYGLDKETSVDIAENNFHVASGERAIGVNRVKFPSTPVYSSDPNHLDTYAEGTWAAQLTPASGSITMAYYHCRYTRIGNLVHVTGEITAGSVSSPSGALTVNLPFANATSTFGRNAATIVSIGASGFTGSPAGTIELQILGGSSVGYFYLANSTFGKLDVSSYVTAGTAFTLSFTYFTD